MGKTSRHLYIRYDYVRYITTHSGLFHTGKYRACSLYWPFGTAIVL